MKTRHLTLTIFALIVLNDIGDTVAQLLMKKGLLGSGAGMVGLGELAELASRIILNPLVVAGIAIYVLNFFIWIVILYKVDLSIAMPVGSFCYIFVPLAAVLFLHERVSVIRWLGTALIVLGISLVSQSKPSAKGTAHG